MVSLCLLPSASRRAIGPSGRRAVCALAIVLALLCVAAADPLSSSPRSSASVSSGYTLIGSFDGKTRVTASQYRSGVPASTSSSTTAMAITNSSSSSSSGSGSNVVVACGAFSQLGSNFVLRVTMGSFTDYIIPAASGLSVCDVLTSTAASGNYRYASSDPTADEWDGYSEPIGSASPWGATALGGSSFSFLSSVTSAGSSASASRVAISFWGFNDEDDVEGEDDASSAGSSSKLGHKGGCCAHAAHETPTWYQPFSIHVAPMAESPLYLAWTAKPAAVVLGAPVTFMVKVWNFRGEVLATPLNYTVNLNGLQTVTQTSTNRASFLYEHSLSDDSVFGALKDGDSFTLSVHTTAPNLADARATVKLSLPVLPSLAKTSTALTACSVDVGIGAMLHFGPSSFAVAPVSQFSALDNDWFAAASLETSGAAGEAFLRPVEAHAGLAEGDPTLPATTQTWTKVAGTAEHPGAMTGVFALDVADNANANGTLQFYAFSLYSAADQQAVLQVKVTGTLSMLMDRTEVEVPTGATKTVQNALDSSTAPTSLHIHTFSRFVSKGYHQVILKLFSSEVLVSTTAAAAAAASSSSTGSLGARRNVTSYLDFRAYGTGLAYALESPIELPDNSYEMWTGSYMFFLMHSGKTVENMLYTDNIDDDLVDIHNLTPQAGAPVVASDANVTGAASNAALTWSMVVFYGGNIPVNGSNIPAGQSYAVRYVALALYNQYDTPFDVEWQLTVRGRVDLYLDGVLQYRAPAGTKEEASVITALNPGWHQLVVRLATPRDVTWIFRFYMFFNGHRLIGAPQVSQSYRMPFGLRPVAAGALVETMLELTAADVEVSSDKTDAMLTFDASSTAAESASFLSRGLELTTATGYRGFFAYANETLALTGSHAEAVSSSSGSSATTAVYRWLPTTRREYSGAWGRTEDDPFAGAYYRVWAFALYAAEAGNISIDVEHVGGFALWQDGALVASADATSATAHQLRERLVALALKEGWQQIVVKLQVASTFELGSTPAFYGSGWDAWADATAVCRARLGAAYKICGAQAYCPYGALRAGVGFPLTPTNATKSVDVFAPVADAEDGFVQLADAPDAAVRACARRTLPERLSAANLSLAAYGAGQVIGCCRASRSPSLSLAFRIDDGMAGKVGYTYHELLAIATPQISVDKTYLSEQTVTLRCGTAGASVQYRLADHGAWQTYSVPFTVRADAVVQAQAFLGSRTSGIVQQELIVPTVVTADRAVCFFGVPCPLAFSGVASDTAASLVSRTGRTPKQVQLYANLTFARGQAQSANFSSVSALSPDDHVATLRVDARSSSSATASTSDIFSVFVYDAVNGTQEGYVTMHDALALHPSAVVAVADVVFSVEGGLYASDRVLLPQLYAPSSDACERARCVSAFEAYGVTKGSSVSDAGTFRVDLSEGSGSSSSSLGNAAHVRTLTCLCVCMSCHARLSDGLFSTSLQMFNDRVAALPISVQLVRDPAHTSTTRAPGRPDGEDSDDSAALIALVVIAPVVLVAIGVAGIVYWWCQVRRQSQSKHSVFVHRDDVESSVDRDNGSAGGETAPSTRARHGSEDGSASEQQLWQRKLTGQPPADATLDDSSR